MIVRILGQGQWEVPDEEVGHLNAIDDQVASAVAGRDQAALSASLRQLHDELEAVGTALADDELRSSDLIIPGPDATLDEVADLLQDNGAGEGLIPG
ncbi:hypothetical protein SAMN05443377_10153 [Propionibacterium cyclohexanicum]|uniref:PspA-associated domain-containing protein n=1 Tax=Propionibacterium cyclohexanicum TaxID=64702 RepID=A0A1H9PJP4_9ACTN|nr:hypothetical protein [Propionibacterium cyclohexanicum]SER47773.1 hypothetical protein SAMN05443377_10153 [Propionibacterium cyclohexanicum]